MAFSRPKDRPKPPPKKPVKPATPPGERQLGRIDHAPNERIGRRGSPLTKETK